jgi:hypothetical protein
MQEQQATVKQPDALSWQFILLAILIALLIPLSVAAPTDLERAARPTEPIPEIPFAELQLTERYDDAGGISLSYPPTWYISAPSPGTVLLTNFPTDSETLPETPAVMRLQVGTLDMLANAAGEVPAPGTPPRDLLQAILDDSQITDVTIEDVAIGGHPAASVHVTLPNQGRELDFAVVTPNENAVVLIQAETDPAAWAEVGVFFGRVLETVSLNIPAS